MTQSRHSKMERIDKRRLRTFLLAIVGTISALGMGQAGNGRIDGFEELAVKYTVTIPMHDGVLLSSDVYLPLCTDSVTFPVDVGALGAVDITAVHKGTQYIYYDSLNGEPNPSPYELPTVFIRTPYNKSTDNLGYLLAFLGYSVVVQDNRGCYDSQGNYLPMFSDAWMKAAYHPAFSHNNDLLPLNGVQSANFHQDGYESLQYIIQQLKRNYEGSQIPLSNGSVGMIGTSALGNAQYQLASVAPVKPDEPGLKGLFPIVASNEHYKSTAVENGVFREALVTNWVSSQYRNLVDDNANHDNSRTNNIHSPQDFGVNHKMDAAEKAIDYWITQSNGGGFPGYYPNSNIRVDMDASFASINSKGEADLQGDESRYTHMNVPIYHLTGWWDIFIGGQIETFNRLKNELPKNSIGYKNQKLVIGPWAHQTITTRETGDITYPENVLAFLTDLQNLGSDLAAFPMDDLQQSEVLKWFRYTLNFNSFKNIGLPKVKIPKATKYERLNTTMEVLAPSEDYIIPFHEFVNYLGGKGELKGFPYQVRTFTVTINNTIDIQPSRSPFIKLESPLTYDQTQDFEQTPDVRLYVTSASDEAGNYWFETDSFPFKKDISKQVLYMNGNRSLLPDADPQSSEISYVHNPNNPIRTVGGANMTVVLPTEDRKSQGQINLAEEQFSPTTLNRADVISFTTPVLADSVTIIGQPIVHLTASSTPQPNNTDSTSTDFMVRVLDVHPDGEAYFVVEGAVNARARNYAAKLSQGEEDIRIPFTNIIPGQFYTYQFQCLPIAYVFLKGHRIQVLISSSNYPRYQSNPNVPLEFGEFFRWRPNQPLSYNYYGQQIGVRTATQQITTGGTSASFIEFPVYKGEFTFGTTSVEDLLGDVGIRIYPNPANRFISIQGEKRNFNLEIRDMSGKIVLSQSISADEPVSIQSLSSGVYVVSIRDFENDSQVSERLIVQ